MDFDVVIFDRESNSPEILFQNGKKSSAFKTTFQLCKLTWKRKEKKLIVLLHIAFLFANYICEIICN
jgi:hypothetical protein